MKLLFSLLVAGTIAAAGCGSGSGSTDDGAGDGYRGDGLAGDVDHGDDRVGDTDTDTVDVPYVSVGAWPTTQLVGEDIEFVCNVSGGDGPLTYTWQWGDGSSSSGTSADMSRVDRPYLGAGTYFPTCTVVDTDGDEGADSVPVVIVNPVAIAPTAEPSSGASPLSVQFSANPSGGIGPYTFLWDFDVDGGFQEDSTEENPRHTYMALGDKIFTARVTVTDASGLVDGRQSDTATVILSVGLNQVPIAAATADPTCMITPTTVHLDGSESSDSDSDSITHLWEIDGPLGSVMPVDPLAASTTFTPTFEGTYRVSLTVDDGIFFDTETIDVVVDAARVLTPVAPISRLGEVGDVLTPNLQVALGNSCGIPYSGEQITWTASSSVVTLDATSTALSPEGIATVSGTHGQPGIGTVIATIAATAMTAVLNITTHCRNDADCASVTGGACGRTVAGVCAVPSCFDGLRNQNETGVDCGGTCSVCGPGQPCEDVDDCEAWLECIDAAAGLRFCAIPGVLFVDQSATGNGNGRRWADAFVDLQDALMVATDGDEVWVAAGTYLPSHSDRTASFDIPTGVEIHGGFAGIEDFNHQADPSANTTTLSGDIDGDDTTHDGPPAALGNYADNCYHVVRVVGADNVIISGLTIRGGHANGGGANDDGAGILVSDSFALQVMDCVIEYNLASRNGGAIAAISGGSGVMQFAVSSTILHGNRAGSGGGLHFDSVDHASFDTVFFYANAAVAEGGGASIVNSRFTYGLNVITEFNKAGTHGGGVFFHNVSDTELLMFSSIANRADSGGGVAVVDSTSTTMRNAEIRMNAARNGGGVYLSGTDVSLGNMLVVENRAEETGGGIFNNSGAPVFIHTTCSDNRAIAAGGMYNSSTSAPRVYNGLFYGNTPDEFVHDPDADIDLAYTNSGRRCGSHSSQAQCTRAWCWYEAGMCTANDPSGMGAMVGNIDLDPGLIFGGTCSAATNNADCITLGCTWSALTAVCGGGDFHYDPESNTFDSVVDLGGSGYCLVDDLDLNSRPADQPGIGHSGANACDMGCYEHPLL